MVAPLFIDWSAYRTTFEDYAGRALGHRVTVLGSADARLLPTPTLTFSDVRVGEAEDPLMVVSRFKMRVELPPLLSGKIQVVDMQLDQPELHLALDEAGRIDWLTANVPAGGGAIDPDDVQLEDVNIVSGAVRVVDARTGKTYRADDLNMRVSARSLQGPFRVDGSGSIAGIHQSIRIATGRSDAQGRIRVKAEIQPTNFMVNLQTDGVLQQEQGKPGYSGRFIAESVLPAEPQAENSEQPTSLEPPAKLWRSEGDFALDPGLLTFEQATFRYGPEERALRLEGSGGLEFGDAPRFDARLRAKQIDLDRIFGQGPQQPVTIEDAVAAVVEGLRVSPLPPVPGAFKLDLPALVVAGGLVQDVYLEAETLPRGWKLTALEARLPGQTLITTEGEVRAGPEPAFSGRANVVSRQPSAFAAWWRRQGGAPLTIDAFSLAARVEAAADGVMLDDITGRLGDAALSGTVTWRAANDQAKARISADLSADRLDLDQLGALIGTVVERPVAVGDGSADDAGTARLETDVNLRLAAETVVYSGVTANGVHVDASLVGDDLAVERFSTLDLVGAHVEASGQVAKLTHAPDGEFQVTVKAERLERLVETLEELFPDNAVVSRLGASGSALAPVDLAASFTARANDANTSHVQVSLAGGLGGSRLDAAADLSGSVSDWRAAAVSANVSLKADDGVSLLRQFGLDLVPVADLGQGAVTLKAEGTAAGGVDVTFIGEGLGTQVDFEGTVAWPAGSLVGYGGRLAFETVDLSSLGMLAGRILPVMGGQIPARASAIVDGEGRNARLRDLDARLGDVTLDGRLDAEFGGEAPRFVGKLKVSEVGLTTVSELLLGADAWEAVGGQAGDQPSRWPGAAFGTPLLGNGAIILDIDTGALDIGLGNPVEQATLSLQLTGDELALDDVAGTFNGGALVGSLLVKRSGPQAAVSGNLSLTGASLDNLVWRRNARPVASGVLDAKLDFEGAGRSISGIVAGLAGGGSFVVKDGEIRGINANAFSSVIRAVDAGLDLEAEEIATAFESHLDAGALPFNRIDGTLVLAAGTARARNVTIDSTSATALGTAQIDLQAWQLESDWSLKVDPGENAVTGADPQVGILFRGPVDAPRREIDIQPFTAFLTLRAFEKEVRRVEELQADILERDRLMRQLRQLRRDEAKRREASEQQAEEARAREASQAAEAPPEIRRTPSPSATPNSAAGAAANAEPTTPVTPPSVSEIPSASPESERQTQSAPREPLSMEEFIKRIRPAIDGDRSRAPESSETIRNGANGSLDPADVTGSLGAPITVRALPVAPADRGASVSARSPAVRERSTPNQEVRRPNVPRYITGPSSVLMPNPAYKGE